MFIHEHIEKIESIEHKILDYIANMENQEENFQNLIKIIEDQKICANQHDFKIILYLLDKISSHHHRAPNFFEKIEQILKFFKNQMTQYFSNFEIYYIFKENKRILLFLIEEKIIIIDKEIYKEMTTNKFKSFKFPEYFSPELKPFIEEDLNKKLKKGSKTEINILFNKINEICNMDSKVFNEKRKRGENDGFIYEIIQKDSIEEFITYINKENYPLKSYVEESIFETNLFLLNQNEISLIEYAAFFGSIQIFKYLYKNGVKLTPSLWIYAVHGENEEMFHILEENKIELKINDDDEVDFDFENDDIETKINESVSFYQCIKESIKCHHNHIVNYISDIFLNDKNDDNNNIVTYCFQYYNFVCLPKEIKQYNNLFEIACKYDYYTIVKYLFNTQKIDINESIKNKICKSFLMIFNQPKIFGISLQIY